ncbi:MAG: hypothetical protein ABI870_13440 [Rhodanobacter sp.]
MSKIAYDDQTFDFETVRERMDTDLSKELQGSYDTDQDFFDAYVIAHTQKYGQRFVVG